MVYGMCNLFFDQTSRALIGIAGLIGIVFYSNGHYSRFRVAGL